MKNLFLIGMAAASMMLASCSSDENVEMANNKNAIEFKTFVNNSTRATDLTEGSLMKFKLWGRMEKEDGTNKGGKPFDGTDFNRRTINIVSRLLLRTMLIRSMLQTITANGVHLPLIIKLVIPTLFMLPK